MNRLIVLSLALALAGCQTAPVGLPTVNTAALVPLSSCDQAIDFVRQVALERMNQQIDEQIARFVRGESCYWGYGEEDANGASPGAPAPTTLMPSTTTSGGTRAASASGTNNQVAGVDEADFVKNDGK